MARPRARPAVPAGAARSSILLSEMLHGSGESRLERSLRAPVQLRGRTRAVEHAAPELALTLRRVPALGRPRRDPHQQISKLIDARTPSCADVPRPRVQV